jgi:hypothetical protein
MVQSAPVLAPPAPGSPGATASVVLLLLRATRYFLVAMSLLVIESLLPEIYGYARFGTVVIAPPSSRFIPPPIPGVEYGGVFARGLALGPGIGFLLYVAPGILSLASLLFLIAGWARWREALRALLALAPVAGGVQPVESVAARSRYHVALGTYVAILVLDYIVRTPYIGTTGPYLYYDPFLSVLLFLLILATYSFAGESFRRAVHGISSPAVRRNLRRGEVLLVIGGLLSGLPLLGLIVGGAELVRFVGPLVVRIGLMFFGRAYKRWP